jgi:hypothetical protein
MEFKPYHTYQTSLPSIYPCIVLNLYSLHSKYKPGPTLLSFRDQACSGWHGRRLNLYSHYSVLAHPLYSNIYHIQLCEYSIYCSYYVRVLQLHSHPSSDHLVDSIYTGWIVVCHVDQEGEKGNKIILGRFLPQNTLLFIPCLQISSVPQIPD